MCGCYRTQKEGEEEEGVGLGGQSNPFSNTQAVMRVIKDSARPGHRALKGPSNASWEMATPNDDTHFSS